VSGNQNLRSRIVLVNKNYFRIPVRATVIFFHKNEMNSQSIALKYFIIECTSTMDTISAVLMIASIVIIATMLVSSPSFSQSVMASKAMAPHVSMPSKHTGVEFHSGPGCPGIGCGVGEIQCPDGHVETPYTPYFNFAANKTLGHHAKGSWEAQQGGQAGGNSDDGTLMKLRFIGNHFVTKGNWTGHSTSMTPSTPTSQTVVLCSNTPLDHTMVVISGDCGTSEVKFRATNGITGTFKGPVTCTP
jgi:hypothetical protein